MTRRMPAVALAAVTLLAGCASDGAGGGGGSDAPAPAPDACRTVLEFRAAAPEGEPVRGLAGRGTGTLPVLVYLMTGEDTATAMAAAEEAARIGGPAVPALAGVLGSKAPRGRGWAAWALGEIGPAARDARPALTAALTDPELRAAATEALRKIGE
ncbi:MAG: HEAT repeat domain-containing protein [Planctomycetia bacterium]|nr:HEAT repeat domain-containing protein [Planctomycetia bacterium]